MRKTAFFQVTLMIFLRPEEFWRRFDLGHNLALESSALCHRILGFFRRGLLLRRMIKNNGAILCANIGPLAIQRRRIMICPENVEQFAIGNFRRIKFHLHYLGMAGFIRANVFVSWIFLSATGVTDRRIGLAS